MVSVTKGSMSNWLLHPNVAQGYVLGAADDTDALQSAMDQDQFWFLPSGTYNLDSDVDPTAAAIEIDPRASFTGAGNLNNRGFWTDESNGANIWRFPDRVYVGQATNRAPGGFSTVSTSQRSWVAAEASGYMGYFERDSQLFLISDVGGIGAAFASRSSDATIHPAIPSIAIAGFALADGSGGGSTAMYLTAVKDQDAGGGAFGAEVNLAVLDDATPICTSYDMAPSGVSAVLWLRSGGEERESGSTTYPTSAAIAVVNATGATHGKGIVFGSASLEGTNGIAVEMAKNQQIQWVYDGTGAVGAFIRSANAGSNRTGIIFGTGSMNVVSANNNEIIAAFTPLSSAVNWSQFDAATTGNNPVLRANGTNTNVSMVIRGKGTGGPILQDGGSNPIVQVNTTGLGFFGATPAAKPTGVAVTAAGIHAALVTLGLIAA